MERQNTNFNDPFLNLLLYLLEKPLYIFNSPELKHEIDKKPPLKETIQNVFDREPEIWKLLLKEIEKENRIFLLLMILKSNKVNIKIDALESLKRVNDTTVIPYLIKIAEKEIEKPAVRGSEGATLWDFYLYKLIDCLNTLTSKRVAHENIEPIEAIKNGLLIWK